MAVTLYPLNYMPYLDTNWSVNPGACTDMTYLAPMQDGTLGPVHPALSTFGFSITGADHLHAEVFPQTTGSSRFLTFRVQNIDEYTSAGVRTNRGTGYSASTTDWAAVAWGNQIIAVNFLNNPQSSTGAGFTDLSGTPPKARRIAANINFVMMADVDDGGSNVYPDMVWWSGIRNPTTWTPSAATQAGYIRLLDAPGPITNLYAFGDRFIVFKENSMFIGTYIGPPHVFSWRLVSATVGLSYPKAVTEVDGKLFFVHTSGVYMFDGQRIQDIGKGIWLPAEFISQENYWSLKADEIEGNVYLNGYDAATNGANSRYLMYSYVFNARTGIWTRVGNVTTSVLANPSYAPVVIQGTAGEYAGFAAGWGAYSGFHYIDNGSGPALAGLISGNTTSAGASYTTGKIGTTDPTTTTRIYQRLTTTESSTVVSTMTVSGFHNEQNTSADTSATATYNSDTSSWDCTLSAKYKTVATSFGASKAIKLTGVGIDGIPAGRHR